MIKKFSTYVNEQYSNPKNVVNIIYGNPQMEHKEKMDKGSSLYSSVKDTEIWEKWGSSTPPLQSSDAVVKDIESLILIGAAQTEEDKEFVKDAEYDMKSIFIKFLKLNGVEEVTMEDLENISKELDPITFGLKYIFNYPRPYQLAAELKLPLYPSQTTDACSPAYPSGHSIDSFVIGGLIGKKFPQLKEDAEKLAAKISRSRLQGGIHFTFDQEFGKQIAEDVLNLDLLSL
jgi:hypothetical protein